MGIRRFPLAKTSGDSPYFRFVIFIPFDELCRERKALADRDLEGRDAVIVVDEVSGDAGFVEVEIFVLVSFHGSFQAVLGVVNASAHSCAVSLPGEFAELDGGD